MITFIIEVSFYAIESWQGHKKGKPEKMEYGKRRMEAG